MLTGWSVSGLSEYDYISVRAVRWVPGVDGGAPTLELGPQDPPPVMDPYPAPPPSNIFSGTISWIEKLAPGVAVAVVSEVYDETPTLAIVYDVDEATLAVTQRELIQVPAPAWQNSDMALVAPGDGRMLLMGMTSALETVFCSLQYVNGEVVSTFLRPSDAYNVTLCWVDFGTMFVEMRLAKPGYDQIEVLSYDVADGLPVLESGTVRMTFARGNGWDYDAVYAAKITDSAFYVIQSDYFNPGSQVHVHAVDVSNWSITPGIYLGGTNAYNSMHQNDWMAIEAIPDRPGSALIHWYQTAMGNYVKSGGAMARFDGEAIYDQKVFYPYNVTTANSTRNNVHDLVGAYLGSGRFVSLAYANFADNRAELPYAVSQAPLGYAGLLSVPVIPEVITSDYLGSRRRFW